MLLRARAKIDMYLQGRLASEIAPEQAWNMSFLGGPSESSQCDSGFSICLSSGVYGGDLSHISVLSSHNIIPDCIGTTLSLDSYRD